VPVRPAIPADVPAILPMVHAITAMHEALDPARFAMVPDVIDRYRRWLPQRATDPRSVFLIAEEAGAAVGFLVATVEPTIPIYRTTEVGFIHDVWVEPAHRGRGHASAMITEACRRFRELGVTQVRLETAAGNDAARRLFAACGFRVSTIEMLAELDEQSTA